MQLPWRTATCDRESRETSPASGVGTALPRAKIRIAGTRLELVQAGKFVEPSPAVRVESELSKLGHVPFLLEMCMHVLRFNFRLAPKEKASGCRIRGLRKDSGRLDNWKMASVLIEQRAKKGR
jgi:hypothetical protein